ncbi:GNAT family N-acetyltransferase [Sulfobacillus harzensis]|uniref:GNAT family N-acetyltransferase n=1 Tax=Sulfobacillus harzensis TaxID=2729629 RepID=UPI001FAE264D|nr:GNAT family N-acetyltransferase [Sulfobacillus harzensis]
MNLLGIDAPYRGQGMGKQAVLFWETDMRQQGFDVVMTSTLSNEDAQHVYRKLGYRDAGCFLLPNEPLEIAFTKVLI